MICLFDLLSYFVKIFYLQSYFACLYIFLNILGYCRYPLTDRNVLDNAAHAILGMHEDTAKLSIKHNNTRYMAYTENFYVSHLGVDLENRYMSVTIPQRTVLLIKVTVLHLKILYLSK